MNDKRLTYVMLGLLVLSNLVGVVTLMGVLPAPNAQPTAVVLPKVQPTADKATNFTNVNTNELDANTGNITTLNATTGNITTGSITALTADTITTTNLVSQSVLLETDIVTATTVSADAVAAATVSVNGTPVFWATPPGNVVATTVVGGSLTGNTGVFTTSVSVAGTPVTWATPHAVVNSAANGYVQCANANVTGSETATPVAGATPVGNPWASLAAVTGDGARASAIYSAGTFTISVSNSALTPAPATTPVAVEWCYIYTK